MFQNDAYKSPLRKYRAPPGPMPTLAQCAAHVESWFWAHCPIPCNHSAVLPWAVVIARLGADASTDRLRRALRCTVCGHKGAAIATVSGSRPDAPPPPIPTAAMPRWIAREGLRRIGVGLEEPPPMIGSGNYGPRLLGVATPLPLSGGKNAKISK